MSRNGCADSRKAIHASPRPSQPATFTPSGATAPLKRNPVYLKNTSTPMLSATASTTGSRPARSPLPAIHRAKPWLMTEDASSISANGQLHQP